MTSQTVSVVLPSEIIYVAGSVNGVDTIWTRADGNEWKTEAARKRDGKYLVNLTATDEAGNSTDYSVTLHYGVLGLITWRAQEDVDRVKYLTKLWTPDGFIGTDEEREEWFGDSNIGSYNAEDLNRVGWAVRYIENKLNDLGYDVSTNWKINWKQSDIPTNEEMDRYLENIRTLRSIFQMPPETPQVPDDMDGLTYQEANDIEQILVDIDSMISAMESSWYYSSDVYSNEV